MGIAETIIVACLAFMLVGDDGLWNVEEGGTHRDDGTETDSFP